MRSEVTKLVKLLRDQRINAKPYHSGISAADKATTQAKWMAGEVKVIVATNSFGMGINKPDVRFVIHFSIPASMDRYAQARTKSLDRFSGVHLTELFVHRKLAELGEMANPLTVFYITVVLILKT